MYFFKATYIPKISSLFTLCARPTLKPLGGALNLAASIIFLRPISKPALCGPLIAFPPDKNTKSNPMSLNFQILDTGGTSAAISMDTGILYFFPIANQSV